ncbi:unnamed protein product, partial [Amoebophrya sp. A120]
VLRLATRGRRFGAFIAVLLLRVFGLRVYRVLCLSWYRWAPPQWFSVSARGRVRLLCLAGSCLIRSRAQSLSRGFLEFIKRTLRGSWVDPFWGIACCLLLECGGFECLLFPGGILSTFCGSPREGGGPALLIGILALESIVVRVYLGVYAFSLRGFSVSASGRVRVSSTFQMVLHQAAVVVITDAPRCIIFA